MTSTEYVFLNSIKRRVIYFQKQNFDKYVILDYIDSGIDKARQINCCDDVLRCLFDIQQKVLLGKKI